LIIEKVNLKDVILPDYNPRKIDDETFEKLKRSLEEFGYVEPIIVNKRNMHVVGGNQRVKALKELGIKEIEAVIVDLDEKKEKALNVALNKITGEWDFEKLEELISELSSFDFDLAITGFDPEELDYLFKDSLRDNIEEDNFDVDSELENPPISHLGDIWLLGRHRLVCGDSTKEETFNVLMDGEKANLVVTDPPYNVDYEGAAGKIKNDNMNDETFYEFLLAAFQNIETVMANDASIYVFHSEAKGIHFRRAFFDAGFHLSSVCIWKKQKFVMGRSPYHWQHEPILFGWKKKGKHNWYSDRKQSSVWEFDRPDKNHEHPTMKPVALITYPILNSSLSNCIVLDPFGGAGSTLIACDQTDRICYTIELDEKYCDIIVKRYINFKNSNEDVYLIRNGVKMKYNEVIETE